MHVMMDADTHWYKFVKTTVLQAKGGWGAWGQGYTYTTLYLVLALVASQTHFHTPPTKERPGTQLLCTRDIFRYIFRNILSVCGRLYYKPRIQTLLTIHLHFLQSLTRKDVRVWLREKAELLLFRRGSIISYTQTETISLRKGPFVTIKTLISLCTQLVAAPSWTWLAFTTETGHNKALPNSDLPREAAT